MLLYHAALSLLPVFAFLGGLIILDSFKLVPIRSVLTAIGVGAVVAVACLFLNGWLIQHLALDKTTFSRYLAPFVEEGGKMLFLVLLIRSRRVGFLVDAAIYGFAIGAGFAVVENIYYLGTLASSNALVWIVRGFGTAALHGTTMVIAGVISKAAFDRRPKAAFRAFVPGFLAAAALHSAFNHFVLSPEVSTIVLLLVLPFVIMFVFDRSERATRGWLISGWDSDVELLEAITSGEIEENRVGRYLDELHGHFPAAVIADMLCLLHLHLELAMAAKGLLLAKEVGVEMPTDPEIEGKLAELKYLEKTIGKTGLLAIHPFVSTSTQEMWQRNLLKRQ